MKIHPAVKKAQNLGKKVAKDMFEIFYFDPKCRGSKFKWGKFPHMCGDIAKATAFTLYSDKEWYSFTSEGRDGVGEDACCAAQDEAERLVKEARVVE